MEFVKLVILLSIMSLVVGCACTSKSELKAGEQSSQKLVKEIRKTIQVQYLLYLPNDYGKENKEWPLILFLHGAGERGDSLQRVKIHGPPKLVEGGQKFPFIIVSPQCPENEWWSTEVLDVLLNEICKNYKVDKDRIYLTGLSMGGYGTWDMVSEYPNRFAAIAPICGGGNPNRVDVLKNLPIWIFHGAKDEVVPLEKSQDMFDALKKVGGNVKITIYPEASHDSWTETYNNTELYKWFLKHKR